MQRALAFYLFALAMIASLQLRAIGAEAALEPAKVEFFEKHIRPVLVEYCYSCHSADAANVEGELLLDSRAGMVSGGASGQAVVPGDPAASLIIKALKHQDLQMPPDQRLSDAIVLSFEQWIRDGAVDPRSGAPPPARAAKVNFEEAKHFWSLQPPVAHPLPAVRDTNWPERRIDYFVLQRLESMSLSPAAAADRETLARRATLDLIGLPPDLADAQARVQDAEVDAWPRFVDRLLASPAFGERWARLWLDLARYAEDQAHIVGDDRSLCYPNAYLYRDWVIEAFNHDLPYNDFVRQQLAADLLDRPTEPTEPAGAEGPADRDLRPLGFLGLGPKYYNRGSPEVMADEWEDRVDVVTRGLLGLTVACARCHDHKYDPIPTQDYYALAGVFASTAMFNRPRRDDVEKKESGEAKKPEDALHIVRDGQPLDLQVMVRGDVKRKGDLAPRGFLQVLCSQQTPAWQVSATSGRRELAEAIVAPGNPLAARVIVNRVWGALIGRPLVTTPSNFGRLGELPSHPELLDDLSVRFMAAGWSVKWLVREIVLSSTYQQSSLASEELQARDPDNVWLARMHRKRLSIEAWRDSILSSAGKLDRSIGGASINPQDPSVGRRTLYSEVSRLELNKMLAMFDFPDPNAHAERRAKTTTALQKLFVLNSPFMLEQAKSLAERAQVLSAGAAAETPCSETASSATAASAPGADGATGTTDLERQLEDLVRRVYRRAPRAAEIASLRDYIRVRASQGTAEQLQAAWVEVAHVLLASNELMFVD